MFVVIWWFGGAAGGEYISGYLIEKSLSVDNVFVWALLMAYFLVPRMYQHRVLFWGIFGALVMRAIFIFAGVALIEAFDWILYVFGAFLLFTAVRMLFSGEQEVDPSQSRFLKLVNKVVPSTDELDGPHLFTKMNGRRLATPLFAVLVLVEATDVIFAVDSVPAVLAVSHEQFIVFSSNAFAILGLRALYFLLADLHGRFRYLQHRPGGDPRLRRREDDPLQAIHYHIADVLLAADHRPDPRGRRSRSSLLVPDARPTPAARDPATAGRRRHERRPSRSPNRRRRPLGAAMAIADDDVDRLRATVSIVDVVGEVVAAAQGRAATGSGCARSTPRRRRRSTSASRPGGTSASAATRRATCSRSSQQTRPRRLRRRRRAPRRQGRHAAHVHRRRAVGASGRGASVSSRR